MSTCAICGVRHSRFKDAAKTKRASYCHSCHASNMRRTRPKYSELTNEQRLKANARAYANVYQRRGQLAQRPCEECGSAHAEKHHEDYTRPLYVHWLCRPCHIALHVTHEVVCVVEHSPEEVVSTETQPA